ncbi:2-oxoglutarate dehydrogenase complex dihydrolipoyllysine-residue succinyltransferase [Alicyclobacillus curvatus]|nr:2-oxoglutarate dehydrogenase complex dihydrolipoyllysine-residue succinyltransferase [Alicyclobacillus curvatus]
MVELRVPELGESIVEATIGNWLKKVGESVAAGEAVVELETDKVNVEVMAETGGILQSILHAEGATVTPGDVIGEIGGANTATAEQQRRGEETPQEVAKESPAPRSNAMSAPAAPLTTEADQPRVTRSGDTSTEVGTPTTENATNLPPRATPAVRRMASEHGVSLDALSGSGGQGRITPADVVSSHEASPPHLTQRQSEPSAPAVTSGAPLAVASSDETTAPREEHIRLSRRRLTIAKRLVEAQHTAAMLTTFNEIDMSAVMDVRKRRKDSFRDRHGVGLGFMSFFTKAVVGALKTIPQLNAEIRGEEMIVKHYYDIGIAVAAEGGLVVPVVRDAERMSFAQIEQQIAALARRARDNQLSLEDLRGGTFTITNGGTFGSLLSTPILNPPQVGILGMHKIEERPVGINGSIVLRPMMYVALSYDHRIVDGAEAVRFLVRVKELLEDPEQLLLEG